MTTEKAFEVLQVERPRLTGKTQADVDGLLAEWKQAELKQTYRKRCRETHPDTGGTEADFKNVQAAYEVLLGLRVRLRLPDDRCPSGHERIPPTAKYCHECGAYYGGDPLIDRLVRSSLTPMTIEYLRRTGRLAAMRAKSPLDPTLVKDIELAQLGQRLGVFI